MDTERKATTMEGVLESIEGNLLRGRLGESARLYRLRIDGRYYFCQPSDFDRSKQAAAVLRHAQLPARVTAAVQWRKGRPGLYWLHFHETGQALSPIHAWERGRVFAWALLLVAALFVACRYGWPWVKALPTAWFLVALPVVLLLAVATLFGLVVAAMGVVDVVALCRPQRLRAYRAYRALSRVGR